MRERSIDFLIEFLIELTVEIFAELLAEIVLTFGWESLAAATHKRSVAKPGLAYVGYALIGLALGALSGWLLPNRFLRNDVLAVLTVVINPTLLGLATWRYGERRRSAKRPTTHLATFPGGAALALGLSVGRVLIVL